MMGRHTTYHLWQQTSARGVVDIFWRTERTRQTIRNFKMVRSLYNFVDLLAKEDGEYPAFFPCKFTQTVHYYRSKRLADSINSTVI